MTPYFKMNTGCCILLCMHKNFLSRYHFVLVRIKKVLTDWYRYWISHISNCHINVDVGVFLVSKQRLQTVTDDMLNSNIHRFYCRFTERMTLHRLLCIFFNMQAAHQEHNFAFQIESEVYEDRIENNLFPSRGCNVLYILYGFCTCSMQLCISCAV